MIKEELSDLECYISHLNDVLELMNEQKDSGDQFFKGIQEIDKECDMILPSKLSNSNKTEFRFVLKDLKSLGLKLVIEEINFKI